MKIPKGNDDWGKGGGKRERDEKERKEEWKGLGKAARDLPRFCQISRGCYNGESLNGFYGGLAW